MFGAVNDTGGVTFDMVAEEVGAGNCAVDESAEKKPSRTDHRLLRLLSDRPTVLGLLEGLGIMGLLGLDGLSLSPIRIGC